MNIKVEFKGKVHKLAPGLPSLDAIYEDIRARYPKHFSSGVVLGFISNNAVTQIHSYEDLLELVRKQGSSSLKLRVFEAKDFLTESSKPQPQRKESKDQTSSFEVVDLGSPQPVVLKAEENSGKVPLPITSVEVKKEDQEIKAPAVEVVKDEEKPAIKENIQKIPKQEKNEKKYPCLFCKATGEISAGIACQVCEGVREITQSHPFVSFIDQIVADRLEILLQKQKLRSLEPEEKNVRVAPLEKKDLQKERKPSKDQKQAQKPTYNFAFEESPINKISSSFNQQFFWNLYIVNNGSTHWPRRVYVYRIVKGSHQEIFEVGTAEQGQRKNVVVTFKASNKNGIELYDLRLGYVDVDDGVVFFGPKFGFEVDTTEQKKVEKLKDTTDDLKKKVQEASKFVKNQKHNVGYLVTRIKELNLGEDLPLEMLVDLVNSLQ